MPEAMFAIIMGTNRGETRLGPFSMSFFCSVTKVPMPPMPITNQDAAITEDGRKYRIDLVQVLTDVWPRSLDLTLVAYEQQIQQDNMEVI